MNRFLFASATWLGFLGVALGAFGAHALKEQLGTYTATWETAVHYQLFHVLAIMICAFATETMFLSESTRKNFNLVGRLFLAGIVFFSGSLYLLALTKVRVLGAVTPLGGLCFLAGWLSLALMAPTLGKGEPRESS